MRTLNIKEYQLVELSPVAMKKINGGCNICEKVKKIVKELIKHILPDPNQFRVQIMGHDSGGYYKMQ